MIRSTKNKKISILHYSINWMWSRWEKGNIFFVKTPALVFKNNDFIKKCFKIQWRAIRAKCSDLVTIYGSFVTNRTFLQRYYRLKKISTTTTFWKGKEIKPDCQRIQSVYTDVSFVRKWNRTAPRLSHQKHIFWPLLLKVETATHTQTPTKLP